VNFRRKGGGGGATSASLSHRGVFLIAHAVLLVETAHFDADALPGHWPSDRRFLFCIGLACCTPRRRCADTV